MANEIRRDLRGRRLYENESQRTDEGHYGLYEFKYRDGQGKRRTISSWRLTESDKLPKGKRDCVPLRTQERQIQESDIKGTDFFSSKNVTVEEMFEKVMASKGHVKETTANRYRENYNSWVRDEFGGRLLSTIKYSDIYSFYAKKIYNGYKISTVEAMNAILYPIFELAVMDRIISVNPAKGILKRLKQSTNCKQEKRISLTLSQQKRLENFVQYDKLSSHWKMPLLIGLWTGCRISEIAGLTWKDIDFKNNIVHVKRGLSYVKLDGKYRFHIDTTKTDAGNREIPMTNDLKKLLLDERLRQMRDGFCKVEIDGVSNFVCFGQRGAVVSAENFDKGLRNLIARCNADEIESSEKENRDPVIVPHASSHVMRHTFVTRLCEVENNLSIVMEIVGHTDIETTLQVYNEIQSEKRKSAHADIREKLQNRA